VATWLLGLTIKPSLPYSLLNVTSVFVFCQFNEMGQTPPLLVPQLFTISVAPRHREKYNYSQHHPPSISFQCSLGWWFWRGPAATSPCHSCSCAAGNRNSVCECL